MKRFYLILLVAVVAVGLIVPFAAPAMACTQGCTPGFWKNNALNRDAAAWVDYAPTQSFSSVFSETITIRVGGVNVTDPNLLQALQAQGGGVNALARHGVAALLNAAYGLDAPVTAANAEHWVITVVQDALDGGPVWGYTIQSATNEFAGMNEMGCPVSMGPPTTVD